MCRQFLEDLQKNHTGKKSMPVFSHLRHPEARHCKRKKSHVCRSHVFLLHFFFVSAAQETQTNIYASKLYPSFVSSGKSGSICAHGAQNWSPGRYQCLELVTALCIPLPISPCGGRLTHCSQLSNNPGNSLRVPMYRHVVSGNVYCFPLQRWICLPILVIFAWQWPVLLKNVSQQKNICRIAVEVKATAWRI